MRPTGLLAAIVVLGIVIFLSPPRARLWIAGIVIVYAALSHGGQTAGFIDSLNQAIYGEPPPVKVQGKAK